MQNDVPDEEKKSSSSSLKKWKEFVLKVANDVFNERQRLAKDYPMVKPFFDILMLVIIFLILFIIIVSLTGLIVIALAKIPIIREYAVSIAVITTLSAFILFLLVIIIKKFKKGKV